MLGTANENPSRLSSHDWLAFNTAQEAWFQVCWWQVW